METGNKGKWCPSPTAIEHRHDPHPQRLGEEGWCPGGGLAERRKAGSADETEEGSERSSEMARALWLDGGRDTHLQPEAEAGGCGVWGGTKMG